MLLPLLFAGGSVAATLLGYGNLAIALLATAVLMGLSVAPTRR